MSNDATDCKSIDRSEISDVDIMKVVNDEDRALITLRHDNKKERV